LDGVREGEGQKEEDERKETGRGVRRKVRRKANLGSGMLDGPLL